MKRELSQVIILSVLLIYFTYNGITSDFPVPYTITLIIAYLAVITYRVMKVLRLKKEKGTETLNKT
ncbi:hypothetical protein BACPU_27950 [Bacillus pumilus]|nr:hypothetical protein BACPU_27950 [Bacillus pumilus]